MVRSKKFIHIGNINNKICTFCFCFCTFYTDFFNRILSIPDSCRINNTKDNSVYLDKFFQRITGSSRNISNNSTFFTNQDIH